MKTVPTLPLCLVLYLMSLYSAVRLVHGYGRTGGSTRNLRQIVLGRCWDYQAKKFGNDVKLWKNCTEICEAFFKAFAYKDQCELTFADYKPYFDAVGMKESVDKSLFWSGTYKAVHSYSDFDARFTTLEDTMAGWIANGLTWCGNKTLSRNTSDGIDYNSCADCFQAMDAFWGQASQLFAQKASGIVSVMVNGSRFDRNGKPTPSYKNNSYFGKFELPFMNVAKVKKLRVIVVHTIDGKILEKCGTKSVKLLETLAKKRGLTTECVDDPPAVKHILCTDSPDSPECRFIGRNTEKPATDCGTSKTVVIVVGVLAGLLFLTVLLLCFLLYGRRKKSQGMEELVNSECS